MVPLSVVLYNGTLDKFYEAVAFLAAARARNEPGQLFLRGPALKAFIEDRWPLDPAMGPPDRFEFAGQTPTELLSQLRGLGRTRVYACSAWVRLWDLEATRVASRVDAVIGLVGFLSQSRGGTTLAF